MIWRSRDHDHAGGAHPLPGRVAGCQPAAGGLAAACAPWLPRCQRCDRRRLGRRRPSTRCSSWSCAAAALAAALAVAGRTAVRRWAAPADDGRTAPALPAPGRAASSPRAGSRVTGGLRRPHPRARDTGTPAPGPASRSPLHRCPGSRSPTGPRRRATGRGRVVSPRRHALGDRRAATSGPARATPRSTRRWRQIYELNRAVIGPDPDLIQPAQRLRLPGS